VSIWRSGSDPLLRIAKLKDAIGIPEIDQQMSGLEYAEPMGVRPSESDASTLLAVIADAAS